ncbi:hypothetical protein V1224_03345 [Lachnospiraceae bacterium JLR.KK008]
MTAKEYLQQLHKAEVIIRQRRQENADLRSKLTSINSLDYTRDRVQTSRLAGAGYEKSVAKIIDLETEIEKRIDDYVALKDRIIGQIHNLYDVDQIKVLYKRYVLYEKFEDIAADLDFSVRNVYKIHGHGLEEFQKCI